MVLEGVELGQLQVDDLFVTAPDLCPDRLRQSGFSIFLWPFAIPPSWFSGMKKGLNLSCQAPVVGLPPFPAPMKKPPFVVKERFFSRLASDYSAENQERVANNYVSSRYGSWTNAKQHWLQNGWY